MEESILKIVIKHKIDDEIKLHFWRSMQYSTRTCFTTHLAKMSFNDFFPFETEKRSSKKSITTQSTQSKTRGNDEVT